MTMEQDVQRVKRMLDDLYRDEDCVPSEEIFQHAEKATLAPDMMYYFDTDRLQEDCYSRQDLVSQVNQTMKSCGRADEVGLIK
jgi:hypothetical protein